MSSDRCDTGSPESFREWMKGSCSEPFVIMRDAGCGECDCLYPTRLDLVRLWLRYVYMCVVNAAVFSSIKVILLRLIGASVGRGVFISPQVFIDPMYPSLISIGDDVILGIGCRILTHEYTADRVRIGRVNIGRGSVIGGWSIVRSGVSVGKGVTVGFGSYVNRDVPDGKTVCGVPARQVESGEA